jgi:hypothetical protein
MEPLYAALVQIVRFTKRHHRVVKQEDGELGRIKPPEVTKFTKMRESVFMFTIPSGPQAPKMLGGRVRASLADRLMDTGANVCGLTRVW